MNLRVRLLGAGLASLFLAAPDRSFAQYDTRSPTPELLSALKPGQWIQVGGVPQRDGSLLCTEVKLVTGDFLDDDWALRGVVRGLDQARREFAVGRYPVRLKEPVEYDDGSVGKLRGFSDLHEGMLVKLEGTYMKDGTFLCKEINDESDKLARKPGVEKKIHVQAKIERVDPGKRSITAMGMTFFVTNNTKVMSAIR